MEYLVQIGFRFHEDVFKTYSGKNKYYCRECRDIENVLREYHDRLSVIGYSK